MRQLRSWARSLCPCCATTGIWSDSAEAVLVPQLQFIEGRCFPSCRRGKSTWSCLFTKPQRLCSCSMFPGGRYPVVQVVCLPVVAHDRGSNGHTAPILRCRTVVAYRQRHVIYIASGPPPPQPNHNHHNHHNHHKPAQTTTNHHKPPPTTTVHEHSRSLTAVEWPIASPAVATDGERDVRGEGSARRRRERRLRCMLRHERQTVAMALAEQHTVDIWFKRVALQWRTSVSLSLAVGAMAERVPGAAMRKRLLRAFHRHVHWQVKLELATALHHSAQRPRPVVLVVTSSTTPLSSGSRSSSSGCG